MKVSYNWLQTFFDTPLDTPEKMADLFTFHSFEVEDIEKKGADSILDVKVLPDRSHDCLSHIGIAREISVLTGKSLKEDSLRQKIELSPVSKELKVAIEDTNHCRRFSAALIRDVQVKESPVWLKERLESIGQKSINNVVDATNFVMFNLGQPLHAFDADRVKGGIVVRLAKDKEKITVLGGQEYTLESTNLLISDSEGQALAIAGVKGGTLAELTSSTTNIIVESANFNPVTTRKTSQMLKLRTDASSRFENEPSRELTAYGLHAVVKLIVDIAGGTLEGYIDEYAEKQEPVIVSFSTKDVNKLLGTEIGDSESEDILKRFGFEYKTENGAFTVTAPFERLDLTIKEDYVAEIGRVYGYDKIPTRVPSKQKPEEVNKTYYYSNLIRNHLVSLGFSEIFTTTFAHTGDVELVKSVASDKQFLRTNLTGNMDASMKLNVYNADLLGLEEVRLFEIGAIFAKEGEQLHLAIGLGKGKKQKLSEELTDIEKSVGTQLHTNLNPFKTVYQSEAVIGEFNLGDIIASLSTSDAYDPFTPKVPAKYSAFSIYPFVSRDISLFVPESVKQEDVEKIIRENGGELLTRLTLFDVFKKDDKTSYAFRLIFQSFEKTLSDEEVNKIMESVTAALTSKGWQVR